MRYVVAAIHPWNREVFDRRISTLPGEWIFIGSKDELTVERLASIDPRFIFFLHWSWLIPHAIVESYECVNFHMTDVPYGRGGSPLQNLILNGHKSTKMSAIRMVDELDAGPVYLKCDLDLSGKASEIYERASRVAASMIEEIVRNPPEPVPQSGEATEFRRRTPAQSRLPETSDLAELYDFIRMLDAPGYPRAFAAHGGVNIEFSDARLQDDALTAHVEITQPAHPARSDGA